MITHYIIMSSSYSKGKRIALDYPIKESEEYTKLKMIVPKIIEQCGEDVSISTHFIDTDSERWKSVVEKDYFFKGVELVKSIDDFIKIIQIDRTLLGIDVAKYIISRIQCTHLKLEKLVYLCYADYLCKYDKKLYQDEIYAFKYGPVVSSVYEKYKQYGYQKIEQDERIILETTHFLELPSKSRILFAKDGIEKIKSIDETLEEYGKYTAEELVTITHKQLAPWDQSGKGKIEYKIIDDDTIKKYHYIEKM